MCELNNGARNSTVTEARATSETRQSAEASKARSRVRAAPPSGHIQSRTFSIFSLGSSFAHSLGLIHYHIKAALELVH